MTSIIDLDKPIRCRNGLEVADLKFGGDPAMSHPIEGTILKFFPGRGIIKPSNTYHYWMEDGKTTRGHETPYDLVNY